jgi:hypothetical protein
MRLAEFVKINGKTMEMMSNFGIRISDYQYTDMYEDYIKMLKDNEKKEYIYAVLKQKYGIPKRTLLRIIKRFSSTC